ncbi:MAG: hypothetical protein RLZZ592_1838 [Pseudomonadota bacterium]|jgi:DNA-binding protein H-NS|nr:DNA-binding protein [Pseudomonadota bacterium]
MMKKTDLRCDVDGKEAERQVALRKIRRLMAFWRIEPHELRGRLEPVSESVAAPEIRYRHPVTGAGWSGQGPQPEWLREALIREGYTVDELRRAATDSSSA